jgi:hypothetical protein
MDAEFRAVFGRVSGSGLDGSGLDGSGLDAELAALADGPPWQPVTPDQVAGLLGSYRRAQILAAELRGALVAAGLEAGEVPGLCGSVDAHGRPVVVLGVVSAATARRLAVLVRGSRGRPGPPAGDRKGKAA